MRKRQRGAVMSDLRGLVVQELGETALCRSHVGGPQYG